MTSEPEPLVATFTCKVKESDVTKGKNLETMSIEELRTKRRRPTLRARLQRLTCRLVGHRPDDDPLAAEVECARCGTVM